MNKKHLMTGGAALLMLAGASQAAVISQTQNFSGTPNYTSPLTFNQFDDNGGAYTLNSIKVTVQLDTGAGAGLRIDNDGAAPASGTVVFGANGIVSSSDVSLLKTDLSSFNGALQSATSKAMNLTADDGDGAAFSTAGSDYDSLISSATSTSDSAFISSLVFNQYIGTGTYNINYDVGQFMDVSSFGGSQVQFDPVTAGGSITVDYNYTIPEPASLALVGLAGGGVLFIRRIFQI